MSPSHAAIESLGCLHTQLARAQCSTITKNLIRTTCVHRYNDKLQRMQRGEKVVDELFTYACPKFVAAVPPRLDDVTVNSNQEAYRHQLREFMAFVDQQRQLPVLKQFLKLYTTISLPKLAALMDTDESSVKEQLRVLEVCAFFLNCTA